MADLGTRPEALPRWADVEVFNPETGQMNVIEPPEEKKNKGWEFKEFPPRNWLNWLFKTTYLWLKHYSERTRITDGNGVGLFKNENCLIALYAVDKTAPANYLHAVGYRGSGAPTLNVISNNVLTLGTSTAQGDQPVSGGTATNIITWGISQA